MFWAYSKFIISLIGIGGGLLLMLGAFSKKSSAAKWSKRALFFAGLCLLVWGALIMIKIHYSLVLTTANLKLIEHYKTALGGIGMGILITLFLSGELNIKKWKNKQK